MPRRRALRPSRKPCARSLMVRLDDESKSVIARAARLRRTSISDYVRGITVAQARREIEAATRQTIALSPEEQIRFWEALHAPQRLTPAQRRLGRLMRGEE